MIIPLNLIGILAMAQTPAPAMPDSSTIMIEETGVAQTYEATKAITCEDVRWLVSWSSGPDRGEIRGEISAVLQGRTFEAKDAQAELFEKFSMVDGVSATCNRASDGAITRTALLVSGSSREGGRTALAQVRIEGEGAFDWTFDIVG